MLISHRWLLSKMGGAVLALWAVQCWAASGDVDRIGFHLVVQNDRQNDITDLGPSDFSLLDDGHPKNGIQVVRSSVPGSLILLVDTSSPACIRAASDFVASLTANVSVTLFDATQLRLVQPATSDRSVLLQAVSRLGQTDGAGLAESKPEGVVKAADELVSGQRMRPWLALCFALAAEQGANPGRKDLVLFATEDGQAAAPSEIKTLAADLGRAGVAVYVLQCPVLSPAAALKAKKLIAGKNKGPEQANEKNEVGADAMRDLALATGGLYSARVSQNASVLRAAVEDLKADYEVSFENASDAADGRFHPLNIQSSRTGLHVRAPAGYYAVAGEKALRLMPYEADLFAALATAGNGSGAFPVDSTVLQLGAKKRKVRTEVVVQIPSAGLMEQQDETLSVSTVRYSELAIISDGNGRLVQTLSQSAAFSGSDSGQGVPDVFTVARSLLLGAGKYKLQVVARDDNSGALSTSTLPFEIHPEDVNNPLSDIVVVKSADKAGDQDDPLTYGSARMVPFAAPRIALGKGAQMPVLLSLDGDVAKDGAQMQLEVQNDGKRVALLPLLGTFDQSGKYRSLVFLDEQSMQPGHYTLVARALDGSDEYERRRDIEILAPDAVRAGQAIGAPPAALSPLLNIDEPVLLAGKTDNPSGPDLDAILARARERAVAYKNSLPDFMCVVNTQQYVARAAAKPDWRVKGDMSEVLRYTGGAEAYRTVEVNGERKSTEHDKLPGLRMDGEFGELLQAVYAPEADAKFTFKGKARLSGSEVYVVEYSVLRAHSKYAIATAQGDSRVLCSFRGLLYIDASSFVTRSIALQAVDIPKDAQYTESALSVSYDYATVNGRQFLLPKRAWVAVRVGARKLMKDEVQFRDYHRFQTSSKITF